jgi:hypothetical protein
VSTSRGTICEASEGGIHSFIGAGKKGQMGSRGDGIEWSTTMVGASQ